MLNDCCTPGVLKISKKLKITEKLVNFFAFRPPKIKNYQISPINEKVPEDSSKLKYNKKIIEVDFSYFEISTSNKIKSISNYYPWIEVKSYKIVKKGTNIYIVMIHIINKNKNIENPAIVFSHGNSSDLGSNFPFLIDLSSQLLVDIFAYDYTGYGHSEGIHSEKEIYSDIEQVINSVVKIFKVNLNKIILMGHSLGSVVSIHCSVKIKDLKGLILVSPIISGFHTTLLKKQPIRDDIHEFDFFSNLININQVECPVFIIHGKMDKVIPIKHVYHLASKVKKCFSWYPSTGDHNNIFSKYRSKFLSKCKLFFEYINLSRSSTHSSQSTNPHVNFTMSIKNSKIVKSQSLAQIFRIEYNDKFDQNEPEYNKTLSIKNKSNSDDIVDLKNLSKDLEFYNQMVDK